MYVCGVMAFSFRLLQIKKVVFVFVRSSCEFKNIPFVACTSLPPLLCLKFDVPICVLLSVKCYIIYNIRDIIKCIICLC